MEQVKRIYCMHTDENPRADVPHADADPRADRSSNMATYGMYIYILSARTYAYIARMETLTEDAGYLLLWVLLLSMRKSGIGLLQLGVGAVAALRHHLSFYLLWEALLVVGLGIDFGLEAGGLAYCYFVVMKPGGFWNMLITGVIDLFQSTR